MIVVSVGFVLLAIYLILVGVITLFKNVPIPPIVLGIVALLAGIFILVGR